MKPFTKIAAVLFALAVLVHAFRLVYQFQIIVGSHEVPHFASIVFIIMGAIMSAGLWKESNK